MNLGDWIRYSSTIQKIREKTPLNRSSCYMRTSWERCKKFGEGMVVGVRRVAEGYTYGPSSDDDGPEFVPDRYITIYVVAPSIRRKHVLVPTDAVTEVFDARLLAANVVASHNAVVEALSSRQLNSHRQIGRKPLDKPPVS